MCALQTLGRAASPLTGRGPVRKTPAPAADPALVAPRSANPVGRPWLPGPPLLQASGPWYCKHVQDRKDEYSGRAEFWNRGQR